MAITITGTHTNTTTNNVAIDPFLGVTVTDTVTQQDVATITLAAAASGVLSGTGVVATGTPGVYTITAANAATLTTEIDAALFTPTVATAPSAVLTSLALGVVGANRRHRRPQSPRRR